MMPVSGNQEPGVLSQKSSICYSGIPIKKRRFPFIQSLSPPREDTPAPFSEMNNIGSKPESTGIDSSVVANTSNDFIQKSDAMNSFKVVKSEIDADINTGSMPSDMESSPTTQLDVKKEVPSVHKVNLVQNIADLVKPRDEEIRVAVIPGSVDKVNSNFSSLVNDIPASHAVPDSIPRFPSVDVKKEMVNILSEGNCKHELSTISGNTNGSPLRNQKVDLSTNVPDKLDSPLLSLSLSEPELPESSAADKTVTDSNVVMSSTDRSNWDLNTTMDAWEGSIEDASINDTIGADELSSSGGTPDVKHFLNVRVDKGKRVMEPFEERSSLCIPSMSFQQFNADDSLRLCLSTSSPHHSSMFMPHLGLQRSIINSIPSGSGIVKSEHVDERLKPDLFLVPSGTMESLDNTLVNKRNAESYEASKNLVGNFPKLIEPTSFKSEVSQESNQETDNAPNFTLKQLSRHIVQHQESCSSSSTVVSGSITSQQPFVTKLTICSELTGCVGGLDQSEHCSNTTCNDIKDINNPSVATQMHVCDDRKIDSGKSMTSCLQRSGTNNIETNNTITEESASDKEKISAMVEDDTYDTDYESDGNQAVACQMGRDDDFEDGEVRESTGKSLGKDPNRVALLSENIKEVDDGSEMGVPTSQSTILEKHNHIKLHYESNGNNNQLVSDLVSLPVTISEQLESEQTQPIVPQKCLVDPSVEEVPGVKVNELMGDGDKTTVEVLEDVGVAQKEIDKGSNVDRVLNSPLSKEEVTVNDHSSYKDSAPGSNRSRIITLPRASDSPSRMRSLSGRAFTLWSGRERYGDVDGDNLHYRGHRDDTYGDDSREFTRDKSFRNPRMDFKRDRGRGSGRPDSLQNKWDPEHGFPSRSFDVSPDYRFNNRHRRADFDAPDGTRPNAGRTGRKPLMDEFHSFRQPSSRRLSPGPRDGAIIRSLPNSRRMPESGSDMPGHRHDISGSGYTRPQASYDEMGDPFVNGNHDYPNVQRRAFTRTRSKSPICTQPRSSGTWPSSRRRFYDDFNNPSDQIPQISVVNRVERMRSPDRVCYTNELGDRRRVSRTNDVRNIDFSREHGHLRPISSSRRSPSDRTFPRSTRRHDEVDSRERTDSDEYFSGPIHPGRFHEFHGNGSNDERRKFGERRSQFRPSRPSYGGGNENHRFNADDGSRPHRFCSDQDTESFDRSNVRQRDFDGGSKPRPLIAQRQIRNTEDQEGGFGQTEQVWHNESFSDGSITKRRRF